MAGKDSYVKAFDYPRTSLHFQVAMKNYAHLEECVSSLPSMLPLENVTTVEDADAEEQKALEISSKLENQNNGKLDTPLHVAVGCKDWKAIQILVLGKAATDDNAESTDPVIHNTGINVDVTNLKGWSPLEMAISNCLPLKIINLLSQQKRIMFLSTWKRKIPPITEMLRSMPDFDITISVGYENALVSLEPPKNVRIWKKGVNLEVETPFLELFEDLYTGKWECLKMGRWRDLQNHRMVLFGDGIDSLRYGNDSLRFAKGSVVMQNLDEKDSKPFEVFEKAKSRIKDAARMRRHTTLFRVKVDFTQAKLERNYNAKAADLPVSKKSCKVYVGKNFVYEYKGCKIDSKHPGDNLEYSCKTKIKKPSIWFNEKIPIKIDDLKSIVDLLASTWSGFGGVMQLLHIFQTADCEPPSSLPVKISIPVIPTVRLVATVTDYSGVVEEPFPKPFEVVQGREMTKKEMKRKEKLNMKKNREERRDEKWRREEDWIRSRREKQKEAREEKKKLKEEKRKKKKEAREVERKNKKAAREAERKKKEGGQEKAEEDAAR